jgi:hypothetical protein
LRSVGGEINQATRHLQEAAKLAEGIGLPGELWTIQAAMGELYQLQGEGEQASRAFGQAAEIVQKLADYIGDDGQRAHFLSAAQGWQAQEVADQSELLE